MSDPYPTVPSDPSDPRVLVFVVAYEAERHLPDLLDRVPADIWENPRVHVLVIDDASADAGLSAAERWAERRGVENLTLLRNPVNQGYGGNQKLGYRLAVDAGFDFVVLLHGDGQYAPELLPTFIEAWKESAADVVLGSRMAARAAARAGGMPLRKRVGNRLLTGAQNFLTGRKLSEYHTGYRGYSTALLRKIPFELNTNDFHFDTEILLAGHARRRELRRVRHPHPLRRRDLPRELAGLRAECPGQHRPIRAAPQRDALLAEVPQPRAGAVSGQGRSCSTRRTPSPSTRCGD